MRNLIEFEMNQEYLFIQDEIHRERPTSENRMKRELLFTMLQLLDIIPESQQHQLLQTIYLTCKARYQT